MLQSAEDLSYPQNGIPKSALSNADRFFSRLTEKIDLSYIPFIHLRENKKPNVHKGVDIKENIELVRLTPDMVTDMVTSGHNYGVYCLKGGLAVIDIDVKDKGILLNPEQLKELEYFSDTFTVRTRNGGRHFYFRNDTEDGNGIVYVNGVKVGELRKEWQYVVGPGSFYTPDQEATPDADGIYTVVRDAPFRDFSEFRRPVWLHITKSHGEDQITEILPVISDHEGIFINDEGISLSEILEKNTELKSLLSESLQKGSNDRSVTDAKIVRHLWWWRFSHQTIAEILQYYRPYQKTNRLDYLARTIGKLAQGDQKKMRYSHQKSEAQVTDLDEVEPVFETTDVATLEFNLADNLIADYYRHACRMVDSYEEYHFGCALLTLAVFVDRRAYIESTQGTTFTNLYLFLLGKSTISGKSSSINEAKNFVELLAPEMVVSDSPGSHIGFIESLADEDRVSGTVSKPGHGVLFQDEAGILLRIMQQPNLAALRDILVRFWDGSPLNRRLAPSRGKKVTLNIPNPYFNMALATTLETFSEASSALDIESGLLYRYLIFAPTRYREVYDYRQWTPEDKTRFDDLVNQFIRYRDFFTKHEVLFTLSSAGTDRFNKWFRDAIQKGQVENNDPLLSLYGRMKMNALKMSMLMTIGKHGFLDQFTDPEQRNYNAEIDEECLIQAIEIIEKYFIKNSMYAFSLIGLDNRNSIDKIIRVLQRCPDRTLDNRKLLQRARLKSKEYNETIDTMLHSGAITMKAVKNNRGPDTLYYQLKQN